MNENKLGTLANAKLSELSSSEIRKTSDVIASRETEIRIRECAIKGTFTIEDHWEDYTVLNSTDPFKVLYLCYRDVELYSDETVEKHFKEIKKFLDQILRNAALGIDFRSYYSLLNPEFALERLRDARERLCTPAGRSKEYYLIVEQIKADGEKELSGLLEALLIDDVLTPDETRHYIKKAVNFEFTEEEAFELLHKKLLELKYAPVSLPDNGDPISEQLVKTEWVPETKISEYRKLSKSEKNKEFKDVPKTKVLPEFIGQLIDEVKLKANLDDVTATTVMLGEKFLSKLLEQKRR